MTTLHLTSEEINTWLDGECTSSERERAINHLKACADCRHEAEAFDAVRNLIATMPDVDVSRSFALPDDFASSAPISPIPSAVKPKSSSSLGTIEPIVRILSIAAVLAFLVLGGAQWTSLIGEDNSNDSANVALEGETETTRTAFQEQEPALARGELREQGDSAAAGAASLTEQYTRVDATAQATSNGLTPLEITTVGIGIVALTCIASWILIHYRAGLSS